MTSYTFKLAAGSLWKDKWINILSIVTIATGLLLITLGALVFHNVELATRRLPERFSLTLFFKDGVTEAETKAVIRSLESHAGVKKVRFISKEDALGELKSLLRDADYVLEGLDENPLPASLEISLKREAVSEVSVKAMAASLKGMEGVEGVQYGEKFLSAIQAIKAGAEGIGMLIMGALAAGVVFVCYSTVKILFYRKKDEIETLQLLGATKGFIRAPFVLEGAAIGLSSGLLASAGFLALVWLARTRLDMTVPVLRTMAAPPELLLYLPPAGLLIGLLGSLIAIGRVKF